MCAYAATQVCNLIRNKWSKHCVSLLPSCILYSHIEPSNDFSLSILSCWLCYRVFRKNCVFIQFLYTTTSTFSALGCYCSFGKWRWDFWTYLATLSRRVLGWSGLCRKKTHNFPWTHCTSTYKTFKYEYKQHFLLSIHWKILTLTWRKKKSLLAKYTSLIFFHVK